ncbi:putative c6 transcription factor [Phaeomoniella chlamydospora]|uniref:Putative c6 transcription factor n=1 Tax=Phaeomoniella chlamydospora TaxID=158046 RepID=A0A0G2EEK7_PHACM|nr:putative c6 transcription factor [Phaeomoniella chlamydospora]
MSISLADHRQSGAPMARPVPAYLAFHSFDDAMNSISKVFSNPTSIESIQAAVSVQLFLVSMLRHNAASRLGGAIVRMAFQLGLHRCPVRFSGFSAQDASLRKRLFWTIYCLDRYICQSIGLPLAIRDDDVDVCYAGQERHIQGGPNLPDMTPVDSTTTAYQPPGPDQRLHLLDFLTRHAEIRGQIMELRNKSISHSQADNDRAVAIDAEISKWWNEVDEWLDSHNSSSLFVTSSHKTALAILRYESIIALKRPILATPSQNSAYRAALQDCVNASRSVISILHKALKRITLSELGCDASSIQHAIPLNWPSYTWVVWMSAFMIIHAANEREFPAELAIR